MVITSPQEPAEEFRPREEYVPTFLAHGKGSPVRYFWPPKRFLVGASGAEHSYVTRNLEADMRNRPWPVTLSACLALALIAGACSLVPAGSHADLAPTLSFKNVSLSLIHI